MLFNTHEPEIEITDYSDLEEHVKVQVLTGIELLAGMPPRGTKNQVLSKKSDNDYDVVWADKITEEDIKTVLAALNIDAQLSTESENPVQNKVITSEINTLKNTLAELTYKPIDITAFSCTPFQAEKGSTVSVILAWTVNRTPTAQTLNNESLGVTVRTATKTEVTANTSYTLKVTGENKETDTQTRSIEFYNGVYYGVATEPSSYDSAFIRKLTRSLQGSKGKTFTVTAGAEQYIYYCLPSSYITANNPIIFNVGGFDGGFSKVTTISFTNASDYTENYDIYRSDNANLGNTTVKVS